MTIPREENREAMTLQTLIQQLNHPDRSQRGQGALSLGALRDERALEALLTALAVESDLFVREDITWALVRQGEAALESLLALLNHERADLRHHAAHVLGKIGDRRAAPALIAAVTHDPAPAVIQKTAFTLSQMKVAGAIPALVARLGHPDSEVQTALTKALESFEAQAVPALTEAARSADETVRAHAVEVLGEIGGKITVPALLAALTDESDAV
ncbi:MAG: HEAT repeat domain-containing protein, partial [Anaerolineae bacterium]|nr:HEAT repeat domain-containing protein [Anaerolineae bacterium]